MRHLLPVSLLLLVLCAGPRGYSQLRNPAPAAVDTVTVSRLKEIVASNVGNVVLVNAWATWCKPCREEMPSLLRIRNEYRGKQFALILVSADDLDELDSVVKPALGRFGVDFPTYIIHDSTDDAFIRGMDPGWSGALPASFLYDDRGRLVKMFTGERSYKQFAKAVAAALKRRGS